MSRLMGRRRAHKGVAMHRFTWAVALSGGALVAQVAHAQSPIATLPSGVRVELRLDTDIDTRRIRSGDALAFSLVGSDCADGLRLRGGAEVAGRVVHAQKAGMFGKAAELLITAGPWTPDGAAASIRFRDLRALAGKSRDGAAMGVAVVAGPFAAFVRGGNVVVPAGTPMSAEIRETSFLPEGAFEPCAAAPTDAANTVNPPVPEEPPQGDLHEAHDVRPVDPGREPDPRDGAGSASHRNDRG